MKKRNPNDLTLRNLRAAIKKFDKLTHTVVLLGQEVLTLKGKVKRLEQKQ